MDSIIKFKNTYVQEIKYIIIAKLRKLKVFKIEQTLSSESFHRILKKNKVAKKSIGRLYNSDDSFFSIDKLDQKFNKFKFDPTSTEKSLPKIPRKHRDASLN